MGGGSGKWKHCGTLSGFGFSILVPEYNPKPPRVKNRFVYSAG
jgi:hypothetical protein